MENPYRDRYRGGRVALELEDLENSTYRAFLSRGRIAGLVPRLLRARPNGIFEDRFWSGTRPIGSAMT